jgi:hypothetical protein
MGTTQHTEVVCGAHWLIELEFASGTVYATTAPVDVTTGGNTYTGLGAFVSVAQIVESEDAEPERLVIAVPVVNASMLALVLGDATTYRGRAARLHLQLFNSAFVPVAAPVARWAGYMEPVRVTRNNASGNEAGSGTIEIACHRAGFARARHYQGLRLTHAQQQQRFAGDVGMQYMQGLIEAPALWLSKKFQEFDL